ncbi:MAG: heme transporter HemC, partial [Pseudomonadota bacterium]
IMAVAYMLLFATLHLTAMRTELMRRRARALRLRTARGSA